MKLKHACVDSGQYGLNISPEAYVGAGVRMLRTSDLSSGSIAESDGVYLEHPVDARFLLRTDDLLLSRAGTIGRAYLTPSDAAGMAFAGFLIRFRPRELMHPKFLYYVTQSAVFQEAVRADAVTSTISNFNADRYAQLDVPDVATDDQQRIANFLDYRIAAIDAALEARRSELELVSTRLWAQFDEAVASSCAPPTRLRRVIDYIADGPFGSAFSSDDYVDDGPAVLRLGNIGFAEFKPADLARVSTDIYSAHPRCHVHAGDLLIASLGDARNHAGRACVAPMSLGLAMVKGKCFVARPIESRASAHFIALLLSSPTGAAELARQGRGSTRHMLNFDLLLSSMFPIPSISEQDDLVHQFAGWRDMSVEAISELSRSVQLLTEYKQALITAAVTGELDVTTASTKLPA